MVYNFNRKEVDNKIELTRLEWEIFEELIKYNGQPVSAETLVNIIYEKYCVTGKNIQDPSVNSIRNYICKLNKKLGGIVKCKNYFGYYISEEVKMM